jgi:hypothetical protein
MINSFIILELNFHCSSDCAILDPPLEHRILYTSCGASWIWNRAYTFCSVQASKELCTRNWTYKTIEGILFNFPQEFLARLLCKNINHFYPRQCFQMLLYFTDCHQVWIALSDRKLYSDWYFLLVRHYLQLEYAKLVTTTYFSDWTNGENLVQNICKMVRPQLARYWKHKLWIVKITTAA